MPEDIDSIEVVEISDADLELMLEAADKPLLTKAEIQQEEFDAFDLSELELFQGIDLDAERHLLSSAQVFAVGPGHELLRHGQLEPKIYFVLEGLLRIHEASRDGKIVGIVDVGQCVGLVAAVTRKPQRHAVISAESSRVVALNIIDINKMTEHSHAISLNYAKLLATHIQENEFVAFGGMQSNQQNHLGHVDRLTGLHNDRWLERMLPRYISRYTQDNTPLTLVIFTIDRLALIREKGGEYSADKVVSSLSEIMLNNTRPTDMMVHEYNDVFKIVLPECGLSSGREIVDRIRKTFKELQIKAPSGAVITGFTLSVGITRLGREDTHLMITDRLNALLAAAKEKGRNCVAQ